ncbi:MAG: plasmid pRiA4b ORF-3 family protein [Candidatus Rokubacteria bacterium]|nr:plasmid pRiA4b ORF-3 family protein [Candidatus Rokubacteria bacterium]MBI3825152.1 plasmid pRiA4b ORF-3 family protein [Candidatus Rokubacteria bacterium]
MKEKPRRARKSVASASPIYRVKITLAEVEPPIWRRIRIRGDVSLERLHDVFQCIMGWQDAHLHEWTVGGRRYGQPEPDEPDYEVEDEANLTLREAAPVEGAHFQYLYDLGDSWAHEVIVERIEPPDPEFRSLECLAAERACPPEDCGGPPGYEEFLKAIRDPRHPEHKEQLAWVGGRFDPEAFDFAGVNRRLRMLK